MVIGGMGKFRLSVRCSREEIEIGRASFAEMTFGAKNRAEPIVRSASLTSVDFRHSGIYEFSLLANYAEIATWELPVFVEAST
jgi:hypothetical protein